MFAFAGSVVSGVYNTVFGAEEEQDEKPIQQCNNEKPTIGEPLVQIQNLKLTSRESTTTQTPPKKDAGEKEYLGLYENENTNSYANQAGTQSIKSPINSALYQSSKNLKKEISGDNTAFRKMDVSSSYSGPKTNSPLRSTSYNNASPSRTGQNSSHNSNYSSPSRPLANSYHSSPSRSGQNSSPSRPLANSYHSSPSRSGQNSSPSRITSNVFFFNSFISHHSNINNLLSSNLQGSCSCCLWATKLEIRFWLFISILWIKN
jgi:hypothetical protein